jgi:hypothetical protein
VHLNSVHRPVDQRVPAAPARRQALPKRSFSERAASLMLLIWNQTQQREEFPHARRDARLAPVAREELRSEVEAR